MTKLISLSEEPSSRESAIKYAQSRPLSAGDSAENTSQQNWQQTAAAV